MCRRCLSSFGSANCPVAEPCKEISWDPHALIRTLLGSKREKVAAFLLSVQGYFIFTSSKQAHCLLDGFEAQSVKRVS